MKRAMIAVAGLTAAVTASAGTVKVDNQDITLGGGAAGGLFFANNVGNKDTASFAMTDFLLSLKTGMVGKPVGVSFEGAIGNFSMPTVYDGGVNITSIATTGGGLPVTGVPYAWMSISPIKEVRIDIGQLATTVGYESAYSLANANILRGMVWSAQPTYYPGMRANVAVGDFGVFAEFNEGTATTTTDDAWGLGATAQLGKDMSFGFTYLNTAQGFDYIDGIGKLNVGNIELGGNLDVIMVDKDINANKSATAFGLALYVTPKINSSFEIPVRFEFTSDADTSVYGRTVAGTTITSNKGGISFTVTPTIKAGDNAFVRAEFAFTNVGNDAFADKDGTATKTQIALGLQGGYRF